MLHTRENANVFVALDDNIYGIHSKGGNILYVLITRRFIYCHFPQKIGFDMSWKLHEVRAYICGDWVVNLPNQTKTIYIFKTPHGKNTVFRFSSNIICVLFISFFFSVFSPIIEISMQKESASNGVSSSIC